MKSKYTRESAFRGKPECGEGSVKPSFAKDVDGFSNATQESLAKKNFLIFDF
jgi:hypothetical protein